MLLPRRTGLISQDLVRELSSLIVRHAFVLPRSATQNNGDGEGGYRVANERTDAARIPHGFRTNPAHAGPGEALALCDRKPTGERMTALLPELNQQQRDLVDALIAAAGDAAFDPVRPQLGAAEHDRVWVSPSLIVVATGLVQVITAELAESPWLLLDDLSGATTCPR